MEARVTSTESDSFPLVWQLGLVVLAIAFTVGLTFASIELPRLAHEALTAHQQAPGFDSRGCELNVAKTEAWMAHHHLRLIGYASLALVAALIVVGFATRRTGLASLGAVALFLPVFAQFALEMFFLAGLGMLRLLWLPALDVSYGILGLADVVHWPYELALSVGALLGLRLGGWLPQGLMGLGLLLFTLGTLAWFRTRLGGGGTAKLRVYRLSRHPQYLGWMVWSYGLIFYVERLPQPKVSWGLASSLPWLLSTLVIVGVALAEELRMAREWGEEYRSYARRTPFLLPLPRCLSRAVSAPMRWVTGSEWPRRTRDIVVTLVTYAGILLVLSAAPAGFRALGRVVGFASQPSIEVLVQRIGEAEGRREKARAVEALEARGPSAVEPLVALLEHEDPVLKEFAAGALGRLGDARAIRPLIAALDGAEARVDVVLALGLLGPAEAVDPILAVADSEGPLLRLHALLALGRIGQERALDAVLAGLEDPVDYVRAAAAEAAGQLGAERAAPRLAAALDDESPRVRVAALFALSRLPSEGVVPHLSKALDDEDWEIRIYAAEALKTRGHAPR